MFNYTAFDRFKIISQGNLEEVALDVRRHLKTNREARILIFSDFSGRQMDLDLSGSEKDTLERLKIFKTPDLNPSQSGPGRPKLGVVPREISLLPSHWEWLSTQPGGSSATIRRLVEEMMKINASGKDKSKHAQETVYTFLNAIAGDLPNFEEALRFLYRRDKKRFKDLISSWPEDLVRHTLTLASEAFAMESK
jgi:uncharacterized protein